MSTKKVPLHKTYFLVSKENKSRHNNKRSCENFHIKRETPIRRLWAKLTGDKIRHRKSIKKNAKRITRILQTNHINFSIRRNILRILTDRKIFRREKMFEVQLSSMLTTSIPSGGGCDFQLLDRRGSGGEIDEHGRLWRCRGLAVERWAGLVEIQGRLSLFRRLGNFTAQFGHVDFHWLLLLFYRRFKSFKAV